MRRLRWVTLLWPGWPQLWFAGSGSGLAIAIGFAVLLDVGLLAGRMWTELLSPAAQTAIWLASATIWSVSAAVSWRWVAGLQFGQAQPGNDALFVQAREEYLKGNWFEAETVLGRLLDRNVLDIEARLLKANLLFHTARRREAIGELDRLTRMEGGDVWRMEIARLRMRLAETREAEAARATISGNPTSGSPTSGNPTTELSNSELSAGMRETVAKAA